jgi:ATP-dependent Clp protease adaptor protein ClpS
VTTPGVPDQPAGGTATRERPAEAASSVASWVTLVWDDPVNLMSYVTHVFSTYFGYPEDRATELMLTVHNSGKAVVSTGTREQMEIDVDAMHSYGLWATLEQG